MQASASSLGSGMRVKWFALYLAGFRSNTTDFRTNSTDFWANTADSRCNLADFRSGLAGFHLLLHAGVERLF
eukprot:2120646-Rhodomonas_salina.1